MQVCRYAPPAKRIHLDAQTTQSCDNKIKQTSNKNVTTEMQGKWVGKLQVKKLGQSLGTEEFKWRMVQFPGLPASWVLTQ